MSPNDEVVALETMALEPLRARWRASYGAPPPLRSPDLLRRMLAWRLQADALGGLDADTRRLLAKGYGPQPRGPQLRPGLRLVREWKGVRYEAQITEGGVRHDGADYASLSEVARAITGVRWNGPRFFGLRGGA